MAIIAKHRLLPALLCGAALFVFACGPEREGEQAAVDQDAKPRVAEEARPEPAYEIETIEDETAEGEPPVDRGLAESTPAGGETVAPDTSELRPQPRVVVVEKEPARASRDRSREEDLAARERRAAEREAELSARERELREAEAPSRSGLPSEEPAIEDEEVAERREAPGVEDEAAEEREEPRSVRATVPAGTVLEVEFLEGLASDTTEAGEIFRARVVSDVRADGAVAIPSGSELVGVVDEAVPLRRVGGRAKLALRFTDLVLPSGATVPVRASFVEQGRSETKKDAATIGGAAAGGAILGRILNRKDKSKGAVIGAVIGAAAGTAIASRTPGEEVVIPEGTVVSLSLDQSVEVRTRAGR